MKVYLVSTVTLMLLQLSSRAQQNQSVFLDSFRAKFNYDTLGNFNCEQVPVGIYALSFRIDKNLQASNFRFSIDSLPILRQLFTQAINTTLKTVQPAKTDKDYLVLIYYTNTGGCYDPDTVEVPLKQVNRKVIELLGKWIEQAQTSFKKAIPNPDEYMVLGTTIINRHPKNDHFTRVDPEYIEPRKRTEKEEQELIEKVNKIKEEKKKQKGN
jgi:hypothetical protein